jgi:2-methylcitrate synthase
MSGEMKVPKGLYGVSVTDTRIGKSDSDGALVYRGYPIAEVAAHASFEETAYLVTKGTLPTKSELESFSGELRWGARLDERVVRVMKELGPGSHPIDVIRTAVSALGSLDSAKTVPEQQLSLEAKMAVIAANCKRVPAGEPSEEPDLELGFSDRFLKMLTKKPATDYERWVFERVLIFYMEHDLNASTYTVRVVASTLADPYAAASAGLAALKGPLHGGANEAAMRMLLEVGGASNAKAYVDMALKDGGRIMGFGHRVYKKFDPRARLCKEYLKEMSKRRGDDGLFKLCDAVEAELWEMKKIPPNLDYYAAPIFHMLGVEVPLYTPIFAASRVFGWMAHYDEQVQEKKLIRPDATYVGPIGLRYVPLDKRKRLA